MAETNGGDNSMRGKKKKEETFRERERGEKENLRERVVFKGGRGGRSNFIQNFNKS